MAVVVVVVVVVLAAVIVVGGGDASGGGGGVERAIFRWEDVVARDFNFGVLGFVERENFEFEGFWTSAVIWSKGRGRCNRDAANYKYDIVFFPA